MSRRSLWAAALSVAPFILLVVLVDDEQLTSLFIRLLIAVPFVIVASLVALGVLHETAHAAVARILGLDVLVVVVGRGRSIARFRVGSSLVDIRRSLIGGVTIFQPTHSRLRYALVVVAGVSAEAMVVVAMLVWQPDSLVEFIVWASVIGVALFDVALNLWPWTPAAGPIGPLPTDGAQLLSLLRSDYAPEPVVDRAAFLVEFELLAAIDAGDHDRSVELARSMAVDEADPTVAEQRIGTVLLLAERWREAYDVLAPLTTGAETEAMLANNTAFAALMTFDDALLGTADVMSAIAFASMPEEPALCNTRGATLLRTGRADEAVGLLRTAAAGQLTPSQKAIVVGFLAMASHALGDHRAAAKHRSTMIRLDARCPVRVEVERTLSFPTSALLTVPGAR